MIFLKSTLTMLAIFIMLFFASSCDDSKFSLIPDNSQVENQLKSEFESIPAMPGAIEKNHNFTKKSDLMDIGSSYVVDNDCKEIIKYYDAKLKERGWQYYKEEKVLYWGKDLGGKIIRYKKNDFFASVQYAGEEADSGWTYGFDISWGISH